MEKVLLRVASRSLFKGHCFEGSVVRMEAAKPSSLAGAQPSAGHSKVSPAARCQRGDSLFLEAEMKLIVGCIWTEY